MRDLGEKWPKIVKKCTVLDGRDVVWSRVWLQVWSGVCSVASLDPAYWSLVTASLG